MAFLTNTFQIEADIKQKKHIGKPVITANDTSTFIVSVQDNGVPMNMSKVTKAVLVNLCPDRQVFETVGVIQGDDKVVFDLPTEATEVAGTVRATVQLHGNDERVSTISFNYEVAKDLRMLHNPTVREKMLIEVALQDGPLYIEQAKVAAAKAEKVATENKTRWLPAVDTVALRNSTYPNPAHGDTVRVNTEATIYRFQTGTGWIKTDQFSPTAIDQVTAQLAEKVGKQELSNVLDGSPRGAFQTLAELQTAYPTGTTGIFVVTADGKWYFWKGSTWQAGGTYLSAGYYNYNSASLNVFDKTNLTSGGYYDSISFTWMSNAGTSQSAFIPISPGDTIRIKPGVSGTYQLVYKNSAGTIFAGNKQNAIAGTVYTYTAPAGAVSFSSAVYNTDINTYMMTINNPMPSEYVAYSPAARTTVNAELKSAITDTLSEYNNYEGKSLSILADSISTYIGYIPSENTTLYNGTNYGVSNVNQMWWKRLIDQTGMTLCVNNAWSGSRVTTTGGDVSAGCMTRATALHTVDKDPDVIVVFIGINDFNNEVAIGSYDGSTIPFPTATTTFREAYAIMLDKILTRYKLAEVYVCTLPHEERNGTIDFPETNGNNVQLAHWNKAIRELADLFGVNILEMSKAGITHQNKTMFTTDDLHPNSAGQRLLANKAIKTIEPIAKFSAIT